MSLLDVEQSIIVKDILTFVVRDVSPSNIESITSWFSQKIRWALRGSFIWQINQGFIGFCTLFHTGSQNSLARWHGIGDGCCGGAWRRHDGRCVFGRLIGRSNYSVTLRLLVAAPWLMDVDP